MIRLLKKEDIPTCVEIVNLNYDSKYPGILPELQAMFEEKVWIRPEYYVEEIDNKIVAFGGYCETTIDYACFGIFWINTHPEYRNKGYATSIVSTIIERIRFITKERKNSWIILTCKDELVNFYGKFGFKTLIKRPNGGDDGKSGYMMSMNCF